MSKVKTGTKSSAFWVDPRTGNSISIGSFPNRGEQSFSTPADLEDALLIVEPEA
jgi:Putative collagen-binding domain of a collagenase